MTKHKALVISEPHGKLVVTSVDTPTPGKGQILIKNVTGAINPVDWKQIEHNLWIPSYPFILGVDGAGIVEQVGEGVYNVKTGDKVWYYSSVGTNSKHGTYQEYSITEADLVGRIPANLTFEEAATLGLGTITAGVGLFYDLKIPFGGPPPTDTILIWGAASSVGAYTVQLAKLTGFTNIIGTASSKNFDYVKSLGVTQVFDYKASDVAQQIKAATHGKLSLVYDAIGVVPSILPALGENGGTIVTVLRPPADLPANVKVIGTYAGVIFGTANEGRAIGQRLLNYVDAWLISKSYLPNKITMIPNGLEGIPQAHEQMKSGQVSATKLVYRLSDTK